MVQWITDNVLQKMITHPQQPMRKHSSDYNLVLTYRKIQKTSDSTYHLPSNLDKNYKTASIRRIFLQIY